MGLTRVLSGIGKFLVGIGVVLLLFTAYQIWGTALAESHSQSQLRAHLDKELPTKVRRDAPPTLSQGPAALAATIAPPPDGQPVGELRIPSIGLDQVVVEGVNDNDLEQGPGHYPGTPLPGEAGNAAIAGHRTTWGHPFYNLDAVKPGNPISITTPQGSFTYRTQRVFIVSPDDATVLDSTPVASLTLTTCNPRYSAAQRLVLRAVLTASRLSTTTAGHRPPTVSRVKSTQLAGSTTGSWGLVVAWGAAVVAAGLVLWWVARRRRRRLLLYAAGTPVLLVLLYFFFASVTPLLPASF